MPTKRVSGGREEGGREAVDNCRHSPPAYPQPVAPQGVPRPPTMALENPRLPVVRIAAVVVAINRPGVPGGVRNDGRGASCVNRNSQFVPLSAVVARSNPDAPPSSLFLQDVTTIHAKRKKSIDLLKRRWMEDGLDSHTPSSRTLSLCLFVDCGCVTVLGPSHLLTVRPDPESLSPGTSPRTHPLLLVLLTCFAYSRPPVFPVWCVIVACDHALELYCFWVGVDGRTPSQVPQRRPRPHDLVWGRPPAPMHRPAAGGLPPTRAAASFLGPRRPAASGPMVGLALPAPAAPPDPTPVAQAALRRRPRLFPLLLACSTAPGAWGLMCTAPGPCSGLRLPCLAPPRPPPKPLAPSCPHCV
jgi:hypothetical protein